MEVLNLSGREKLLEDEIQRLKKKCNLLIEKVEQQEKELQTAAWLRQVESKGEKSNKKPVNKGDVGGENQLVKTEDVLHRARVIFKKIAEDNLFIPYVKQTQNSKIYCRLDKRDWERLEPPEELVNFMKGCGLVKIQSSGSIFWNDSRSGKSIKTMLILKSACTYFSGRDCEENG